MNLNAGSLFSLAGKTAFLTGASGFLGRTMAEALLANGARLLMLGRSEETERLAAGFASVYGASQVQSWTIDMYDLPALEQLLMEVAAHERIDILVNNAYELGPQTGFNVPEGRLGAAPFDQWLRSLTGGIYWAVLTAQKLGLGMKERGGGSIINIASMYAKVAPSPRLYAETQFVNPPSYSAAKAGLVAFTRYVASFWGPYGVRANAILPGPIPNVDYEGDNSVREDDVFLERLRERTCLQRFGRPDELAGALLFLASEASSFVTGHELVVDGGWTVT